MNRLFWDIETRPCEGYFWRPGKVWIPPENITVESAIINICYKWEGTNTVHSLEWDKGDDSAMIAKFLGVAESADEMVAHNGDKFDMKWFHARCLKHGIPSLTPNVKTVDTYVIAKRRFNLNSYKLDYLAWYLFGERKIKTEFKLWTDIVEKNCPVAMAAMVEYCQKDVSLVERVYNAMIPFHMPKSHVGVMRGLERWSCAHCASENVRRKSRRVTAAGTIQHGMNCNDCRRFYQINDKVYRDWLEIKNQAIERQHQWSCTHCASEDVRRSKSRTTRAGVLRHNMFCGGCMKYYTIDDISYQDWLDTKEANRAA